MQNNALVGWVLAALVVWAGISWYWYVCGIKGFCRADNQVEVTTNDDVADRDETGVSVTPRSNNRVVTKEVVTEEVTVQCSPYLDSFIRYGYANNSADVQKLESFFNMYEGEDLEEDGSFSRSDEEAVKRFQLKYRAEVMDPWGMTQPSGYVFTTTRNHINALHCAYEYAKKS